MRFISKYQHIIGGKFVFWSVLVYVLFASFVQASAYTTKKDSSKSVIIKESDISPLDLLRGDTNDVDVDTQKYDYMPGSVGHGTMPYQDSNYIRALRLHIPNSARLANDLRQFAPLIPGKSDLATRNDIANNALNLPPEYYLPLDVDVANYQYNMMMSQNNVTGIKTINPFGLKISLGSIGKFLGFVEDVSPVITYEIDYRTEVQVLIYSMAATVVATIFEGIQTPGTYTYTWNGRNDAGRRLPPGDYVAEVRIGKQRFIRKHIVIGR